MRLERGDIVLLPFPYTNFESGKQRPAWVLTRSDYNERAMDVVLAYMTSQRQDGPWAIKIDQADLRVGHLPRESWVRVDRIATLEQRFVRRVVGSLDGRSLERVQRPLMQLLG